MIYIVDGVISLISGIYICLVLAKVFRTKIALFNRYPVILKIVGPTLVIFGLYRIFFGILGGI